MRSLFALEQRQYTQALRDIDEGAPHSCPAAAERQQVYLVLADLMAGLAHARAGRLDRAREHLDAQTRLHNPDNPLEKGLACGARRGDRACRQAIARGRHGVFGRRTHDARGFRYTSTTLGLDERDPRTRRHGSCREARGDVAGALDIYRRLLVPGPEQKWAGLFDPRHVLETARLLEQSGNKKAALGEYQRFLELWKNADSILPELAEARRAVARLRVS
jgi:tetratricopeptide (TPR) repeat protein